jgi:preprotein translocase subunit Sss1
MLRFYVRARTRLAQIREAARQDDRGETVEKVVIVGLGLTAAGIVGAAIVALTNEGISRWALW